MTEEQYNTLGGLLAIVFLCAGPAFFIIVAEAILGPISPASVDTLPKGRDAQQGSVGTKGSAVPKADAQNTPPGQSPKGGN